ncbi:hypothetical protein L1887_36801 [Cichorium endivia]|nr:hypothetical protein L1887_36801 [Cichorium endivia]
MGACVSTHQKPSAMKVQVLFGSDDINLVKPPIINGDLAAKPQGPTSAPVASFRDFGSKEETFFDTQAWLESDCDDDFMSVNGDFTPSRGNTPVHHNFSAGNTKPPPVSPYQPSPNGSEKKIRLSDLFKDSLRGNYESDREEDGEVINKNGKVESPIVNGGNGLKTKKNHGCFPSLLYSRSSNGRKMMSPNPKLNPNPNPVVG